MQGVKKGLLNNPPGVRNLAYPPKKDGVRTNETT